MTAIAVLPLLTSRCIRAQTLQSNDVRADQVAARVAAERYEEILRRRPQMGAPFDKLYEFHSRQGTIAELCKRLELTAKSQGDGNLFQLLGLFQLRQGLHDDAIGSLTRAENLLPKEPLVSLYRSRALALRRQYVPALDALKVTVDRKPSQALALEILKELRTLKDREVDRQVAVELLANLEQQFSNSPQVIEKLADCLIEFGQPEEARPVYEKLIELTRDPLRRIELRVQLARLKKRLGDPEQSLSELEGLVAQVKPQSWLYTSLIEQIEQLTEELHGTDGLIKYYERALQRQPDDVAGMLRLAEVLRNRSRFEDAQVWISKAIESAPSQPEPLLAMSKIMEDSKQFTSASNWMQQLVQLDPANADYIISWGRLAALEPNGESPKTETTPKSEGPKSEITAQQLEAAAIWRRLLIGHENDPNKAIQVAELLRSVSLSDEALLLYEQAVRVSGGKIEFSELLGDYLLQLDRREEARKVFTSAMGVAQDDRASLIHLSEVLTRFKFIDEAITALATACDHRPQFGDLIQLAKLLIESKRFETALEKLRFAANSAESSTDFEAAWDLQDNLYKRIGGLPQQIVVLEKSLLEPTTDLVDSLQRLAMMQAANNQPAEATATALKATVLQPHSKRAWLLAARLQRDAGMRTREIESLGVLGKLDAKLAPEYLQRMATIHFQLNQFDEALATAERIFDLPTANLQHFQVAASFCLQANKVDQAIQIMRRATQVFPNDRSAWLILARQLAKLRRNPPAIDASWRVLELSRDHSQQREAIDLLVALHPGAPSSAELVAGLKQFGLEHKQENEATLWSAWVWLGSGGNQTPSELMANLLNGSNSQPEHLHAAMELAVRDRKYSQAVMIQQRLCREQATVANQLKLGELLWRAGDSQAATLAWKAVMRYRANDLPAAEYAKELIDGANWTLAANLVQVGVELKVNSWEFLTVGIYANVQAKNLSQATEFAEQLLAMDLPPETMFKKTETSDVDSDLPATARDRLVWLEHAGAWQAMLNVVDLTRASYRTNQSNPRASQAAAIRHLAIQRGASIGSTPVTRFNVQCFAEARALAVLVKFGRLNLQHSGATDDWEKYVEQAIASKNIGKLWDCVLVMEPMSCRAVSFTAAGAIEYHEVSEPAINRYAEVLDAIVALDESAAIELAINDIVMRRQLQHQMVDRMKQAVPAMDARTLSRLQKLIRQVDQRDAAMALSGHVTLAVELMRLQRVHEGQQLLEKSLAAVTDISQLATCARQFVASDRMTRLATSQILLRAYAIELETGNESNDLAFAISSFRNAELTGDSQPQDLMFEMIRLQSKHVEGLSAEQLFTDSRSNESRRAYRNFRKSPAAIPDRSSLLSASLRAALIDSAPNELTGFVVNLKSDDSLTPSEQIVRSFAASVAHSILNNPDRALAVLKDAKKQSIATEIVSLFEVWLLVANQRLDEARDVLNKIEPPNEAILRECELWKMDLGSKLGNREEALRAARVLAKLPLSVHESADVATVLNQ